MSRTVLITGANRGIGLALAKEAHARGDRVLGTARDPSRADELSDCAAEVLELDVSSDESCKALGSMLTGEAVDLLINGAGVFPQPDLGSLDELDADTLMECYRINALGPLLVTRAVLPSLRAAAASGLTPLIVMVTSQLGSLDLVANGAARHWYAYCSSKAALNMSTAILSREVEGDGVRAIAIHPGWVQTDMGGSNADITPEVSARGILDTIAKAVSSPASDRRPWVWDGSRLPW